MRNTFLIVFLYLVVTPFSYSQDLTHSSISDIKKHYRNRDYDLVLVTIEERIDHLKKGNSLADLGSFYLELGEYYNQLNDPEKSLHFLNLSEKTFTSIGDIKSLAHSWHEIAGTYYNKQDYKQAEKYWLKAMEYGSQHKDLNFYSNNLINVGEIYRLRNDFTTALSFYNRAIKIKRANQEDQNLSIAYLNKGIIYSELNRRDSAQYCFEMAVYYGEKERSSCTSLGASLFHFGKFLQKNGDFKEALVKYNKGIAIHTNCDDLLALTKLLPNLVLLYNDLKLVDSSLMASDQLLVITEQLYRRERERHGFETEARFKIREHEQSLEKEKKIIEQEVALVKKQRRIQIILFSAGALILLLIIWISRQKNQSLKQRNKLIEREKEISVMRALNQENENQLMKEKHQLEIHQKNKELTTTAMNVVNKNDVLNRIHDLIKDNPEIEQHQDSKKIIQELRLSQSIENDWNNFKLHFEQIHTGFFKTLYEKYPILTDDEIKVCSYLRIGLSTNEISQILNILPNSVNKRRNRLRKKFELLPKDGLIEFLNKI
ncbi:MAG: hypothetical protein COA38_06290 [Fluviicola sp.]|nr:MAG: hypothetical protein COA38_06290 [Fluviicola sp.]